MKLILHKINPANDKLEIKVADAAGAAGAHHRYEVTGFDPFENPSRKRDEFLSAPQVILFQNGPINNVGVNGLTHEALLAILIHRMECFQSGPYACRENALALTKMQEALMWLHMRTKARMERGVEGTHNV